jgi:phosphate transport system protein
MVIKYRKELNALKEEIGYFGDFSIKILEDSITALKRDDASLAKDVYSRKKRLGQWTNDIEERSLRLVALYQPMGEDLRTISCINRMNYSLFRIGRIGKNIAKLETYLVDEPNLVNLKSIIHMSDLVLSMVRDVISAYESGDLSKIRHFEERDDIVDSMRSSIFRECLTYMMQDPRYIPRCTDYITISRHLERTGDHACLMAEKIIFMYTGERVEIR